MTLTWDGPTPWDAVVPYTRTVHYRVQGYRAAMNSPEVRAMHEELFWFLKGHHPMGEAAKALAAYEAGLKEEAKT